MESLALPYAIVYTALIAHASTITQNCLNQDLSIRICHQFAFSLHISIKIRLIYMRYILVYVLLRPHTRLNIFSHIVTKLCPTPTVTI